MSVKFRLGFTVEAQTLFALMSKLLPIENLHVEELIERDSPNSVAKLAVARLSSKVSGKGGTRGLGSRGGPDLKKGVNAIIVELLSDGKSHRAEELKPLFKQRSYSSKGVAAALAKLERQGVVRHTGIGLWQLAKKVDAA